MKAASNHVRFQGLRSRVLRQRMLAFAAALGISTVGLLGGAPAAHADDVRSQQWYLGPMKAAEMWGVSTGEGVKVAVIDSGVNTSTPSLQGQVLPGKDFTGEPGDEYDDYDGHGTTMASLIAGTGKGGGIQGLAPGARIIPYRVLFGSMGVQPEGTSTAPEAIRAAANSEAKIISMSFGAPYSRRPLEKAVEYALSKGKLLFAGTGNNAKKGNEPSWPASYEGVVGIGAFGADGVVAEYSNYGFNVDLTAPGVDVPAWCDDNFQEYCSLGGTSAATALASASAALIWAKHPDWTANQVKRVLIDTAGRKAESDKPSKYIGWGAVRPRINLLEGKGDPGPAGKDPLRETEPSTSPSASSSSGGQKGDGKASGEDDVNSAASASGDESNLWIYLGGGVAAAAVLAGAAFLVTRMRRT
jgi:type VII secretion-associated serine protease mycosin